MTDKNDVAVRIELEGSYEKIIEVLLFARGKGLQDRKLEDCECPYS